jgi:uncharacterized membrane protein (DUF106 family)
MKQIINSISIKAFNIFFPFFMIALAITIGLGPAIIAVKTFEGWWMAALIISVPVAIVIIVISNNLTDWDNVWEFDDIHQAINKYEIKKSNLKYEKTQARLKEVQAEIAERIKNHPDQK